MTVYLQQNRSIHNPILDALISNATLKSTFKVFIRGSLFGIGSKIILSLTSVKSLRRLLLTRVGRRDIFTSSLLFGTLTASFKGLTNVGIHLFGLQYASPIVFISALCAGQAMRLEKSGSRRSLFATYSLVRACWSLLQSSRFNNNTCNNNKSINNTSTSPSSSHNNTNTSSFIVRNVTKNGAPLLFILSCTNIMWCWFYYPKSIEGIYRIWITKMAHMDADLVKALRYLHHGKVKYGRRSDILRQYSLRLGLDPTQANLLQFVPQKYVTHGYSTSMWLALRFLIGLKDSVPLYLPVHLIPSLLFQYKKWMQDPKKAIGKLCRNVLQSSSFLASFITLAWAPILLTRLLLRKDTSLGIGLGCLSCGLSIYCERPSRRRELAMFVFPRVLEIWYEYVIRNRWMKPIHNGAIWIFSVSLAIIAERSVVTKDSKDANLFVGLAELMFQ